MTLDRRRRRPLGLSRRPGGSRALATLLFGVSPLDPLTYGGVAALLFAVAAFASAIPATRAAWIDPSVTLRSE